LYKLNQLFYGAKYVNADAAVETSSFKDPDVTTINECGWQLDFVA